MEHSAGKIVKNTVLITGAMILQKVISFAYFLFLSSRLSPDILGSYVWALSFTSLFSIGADLGLAPILTREAARNGENDEKYIRNMLGIKLPLIFITLVVCLGVLFLTKSDWQIRLLVLGASAVMIFDALSIIFYSFLRAKGRLSYESAGIVGFQVITMVSGVIMFQATKNITLVMLALVLASAVNFIYSAIVVKKKYHYSLRPSFDKNIVRHFLRLMPAFALSGIFIRIYNVSDSVLLGYMKDNAAVGLYSVPAKAVTAFQALIPGALQATIYPAMSHFYINSREKLKSLFEKSFNYLVLFSVPLALGLYMIAEPAIRAIWPKYMAAVPTFKIMALALPSVFLAFPTGLLLRACDRQNANTWNRGVITVLSVLINIILIPVYGVLGAGIAFFIVNAILLFLDLIFVGKVINYSRAGIIWYFFRTLFASAGMAAVVYFALQNFSLYIAIGAGGVVFLILAWIFKIIKKEEVNLFKNVFYGRARN
ncbi:MAG: flippase [bacterium]